MPYIDPLRRVYFTDAIDSLLDDIASPGDLNFVVTTLLHGILNRQGESYGQLNALVGVLECAKLEFYRRKAVPYEDGKIAVNGDVEVR